MANIEHVALWVDDLERMCAFYAQAFGAESGAPYVNAAKGFESRFLTFATGARLELMTTRSLSPVRAEAGAQRMGLTHLAISLGSEDAVRELTERLRAQGAPVLDGP